MTRRRRLLGTVAGLTVVGWTTVLAGLAPWWSGAVPTLGLLLVVAALTRHGAAGQARVPVATPRVSEVTAVLPAVRASSPTLALPVRRETAPSPLAGERSWQPVPVPLPTYLLKDRAPFVAPPLPAVAVAHGSADDEHATQVIDLREHAHVAPQVVNQ